MAVYSDMKVTNEGKKLYARAIAGETLTFTKIVFGGGNPTEAVENLTNVVDFKIEGAIKERDTTATAGVCRLLVEINNANITSNINVTEIGVFAKAGSDTQEVMYAYAHATEGIDVIPANTAGSLVWKMWVSLSIVNANSVEVTPTEQNTFANTTPTVTPVSTDGTSIHLNNILASCRYRNENGIVTAFYEVTGSLLNMSATALASLKVSLPTATASKDAVVLSQMAVTESDDSVTVVDVMATVKANDNNIDISWFGGRSGTFKLLMTATYLV